MADLADRPFRWEDLDQRLLSPRLQDLAEDMHKRVAEGERKAAFDAQKTGNTAGYLPRLFEVQHQLTDEWAKKLYDVHCEVWRIQGHSITADFIRAVSNRAIPELILGRKGAVEGLVQLWCTRTGRNHDAVALGHWTRMMVSLRAKWVRKLEAEAVASEYRASQEIAQRAAADLLDLPTGLEHTRPGTAGLLDLPAGLRSLADPVDENPFPNLWQSFGVQFEALADEELQPSGNAPRGCLTARVSYENGSECGEWFISGGYDEHFTARCTTLLSRAGAALKPPKGTKPLFFWLRRLYLDLLKHKSKNLCFARQDRQQGIIQLVPRTSATLCSRLEQESLENYPFVASIRKLGRTAKLAPEFVSAAGGLWSKAIREGGADRRVTPAHLKQIASELDSMGYIPPSEFLAKSCATELKSFNSHNSNSKVGPIKTWSQLVSHGDKDHLRGMRKLLSNCAAKKR